MKSRHKAREVALQILYRYDVNAHSAGTPIPQGRDLAKDLERHFDHFQISEDLRPFAAQLVVGSITEAKGLDSKLETHASNWKVSRMGFVDRSLLRMAAYEMIHLPETPSSVVIDEAIELAKQFGTEETPPFINGILDSIKKAL